MNASDEFASDDDDDHDDEEELEEDLFGNKRRANKKKTTTSTQKLDLIENMINLDPIESADSQPTTKKNLVHYCSYFQSDNDEKCKHQLNQSNDSSLQQPICLNCEYERKEKRDSLEQMAFYSPDLTNADRLKKKIELVFDSPTLEKKQQMPPEKMDLSVDEDPKMEEAADSTLIESKSMIEYNDSTFDSSKSGGGGGANDSTFIWSDSDDDDHEFVEQRKLEQEKKRMLKRKCALSDDESSDEAEEERILQVIKRKQLRARRRAAKKRSTTTTSKSTNQLQQPKKVNDQMIKDGHEWFTPCARPPKPDDLNEKFIESNDAVVRYVKDKENATNKYRLKLNLDEFESKFSGSSSISISSRIEITKANRVEKKPEVKWFTPAIPCPSFECVDRELKTRLRRQRGEKRTKNQTKELDAIISQATTNQIWSQASTSSSTLASQITIIDETIVEEKIVDETIVEEEEEKKKKKKKKKTVRFNEIICLVNENDEKVIGELKKSSEEKSHLTIGGLFKEIDNEMADDSISISRRFFKLSQQQQQQQQQYPNTPIVDPDPIESRSTTAVSEHAHCWCCRSGSNRIQINSIVVVVVIVE